MESFTYTISDPDAAEGMATVTVTITGLNDAPILASVGNQTVDEEVELTFTATATDVDLPADTLTFSLSGEPAGAAIDANSGLFTWTPTEAQGGITYTFDVVVTDDGTPNLAGSETIMVTVNEVNVAPVLDMIGNQTVDEQATLNFTATANDQDIPAQNLTFGLDAAAMVAGMSIDATSGEFSFAPTESQGGMIFSATITVTDNGTNAPDLTDTEIIMVTVDEVNVAPVLAAIGNQAVITQATLTFTATATDQDLPPQNLTFSLDGPAIADGMSIDPNTGEFSFTPTAAQGDSVFDATITVTDNGTNAADLTDFETISIAVTTLADLSISKSDSPDPVVAGTQLTYTLAVTNAGPNADPNTITVTETLPAGVSFSSASGTGWSCNEVGGVVTCTRAGLTVGAAPDITISVNVDPATSGTITNNVSVSSPTTDPVAGNDSGTEDTTVNLEADLSLTKSDSPDPVIAGNSLTYTLTVTNLGPSDDPETIKVLDALPAGIVFDSVSGAGWTCSEAAGLVTCTRSGLAVGSAPDITINTTVDPGAVGAFFNIPVVSSPTTDPDASNDTPEEDTTVNQEADLSITKTDSLDPVTAGDPLMYTLSVTNLGPSNDPGTITVTDMLPAGLAFDSASGTGWTCGEAGGTVTCTRNGLAVGAAPDITINTTVDPGAAGTITNEVWMSSPTTDPDSNNDHADEDTFVIGLDDAPEVSTTAPANSDTGVEPDASIVITFSEPVTVTGDWFHLDCVGSTLRTVTGGDFAITDANPTFTLNPNTDFTGEQTCTGTVFATQVTDDDVVDPPNNMVSDFVFSFTTRPVAADDAFDATGNVGISVPANGVLGNDEGAGLVVSEVQGAAGNVGIATATGQGGAVTLNATGDFTYEPPAGFEGSDTFTYTATGTTQATVTITVSDMIWFIDGSEVTNGDGRLNSPFNCLVGPGCFDTAAVDADGDNIFIADGSYTGGLTLLNNQKLIGDGSSSTLEVITGITLPTHSASLPAFSGTDPIITTTVAATNGISLGSDNTIRGLTIGNTTGAGMTGTNVGTLSVSEATISGTGGAMNINSGILDVSLDALSASSSSDAGISLIGSGTFSVGDPNGTININGLPGVDITGTGTGVLVTATFASVSSSDATHGIRLQNLTSGSSFNGGNTTVTASTINGIALNNNAGSNFTFADLDINNFSTNARGIFASTSGTLNISDGDIDGGSNRGVDIDNTDLNVTLASVTSVGGTLPGIDLNTTTGSLEIAGDGSNNSLGGNASGGTISNKTGNNNTNDGIGVLLNGAAGVTLRRMQMNDFTNFAIRGTNVTGFALNNCTINGANGNSAAADEGSVRFSNLLGSAAFTESIISGGHEDNINVTNTSGTLDRMTVTDSTIGLNHATAGNDGILVESQGSAVVNITVAGTTFLGARGDLLQTNAVGTSTMDVLLQDNAFHNAHPGTITGGGGISLLGGSAAGNINVTYEISGTTAGSQTFMGARGSAINTDYGNGAGTANGTIHNNAIGVSGVAGSASTEGSGIAVKSGGSLTHTVNVDNNDINGVNGFSGIFARANNSSTLNATITNSIADEFGGFTFAALALLVGGATGSDTATLCADIRNNTFNTSAVSFTNAAFFDQLSASAHYNLPGYGGASGGGAASTNIATYLTGRGNTLIPDAGVSAVDAFFASGITGTGTTCPLLAALGEGPGGPDVGRLTRKQLTAVVKQAIGLWSAGRLSHRDRARLDRVMFEIVDLPDGQLGGTNMMRIAIDHDGAGYGWSTDKTAAGKMDLLTVVMHELGHVLGRPHEDGAGVMAEALPTGVRRLPGLPQGREPDPPDRWRSDVPRAGVESAIGKGGVQ